jgi:putative toxin-antitoxin system antitoxin component (TIGR02293 family)
MIAKTQISKSAMVVEYLSTHYAIQKKDLADIFDVTPKTLLRWKDTGTSMSLQQADRAMVVKSILKLGETVLGSAKNLSEWLDKPVLLLGGEKPMTLLKTESGRREVESVLHQIENGFF